MVDSLCLFFFNDTATPEIYTLPLHDALPIGVGRLPLPQPAHPGVRRVVGDAPGPLRVRPGHDVEVVEVVARGGGGRSEEHTSELQSRQYLVCRLLLEKKKKQEMSCINLQTTY